MLDLIKKKKSIDDSTIIIKNNEIPYEEIKDKKKVTFVIASSDKKVIQTTCQLIINYEKENPDKEITVFLSSSYETVDRIAKGII